MSAGVENSPHDRCGCGEAAGHVVAPPAWEQLPFAALMEL